MNEPITFCLVPFSERMVINMKLNGVLIKTFIHSNGHKCNVYVPTSDYYSQEHEISEHFVRDITSIFETQPELRNPIKPTERKVVKNHNVNT